MGRRAQTEQLRGTLDLLVLESLTHGSMHGWGVGQWIQDRSEGLLEVNQGSLYPALQRLEQQGLVDSEWRPSENNRRARYYSLTAAGRQALGEERESWRRFATGVETVLKAPA